MPSERDCSSAHWVFGCTGHGPWGPSFIYSATPTETTFFFPDGGWVLGHTDISLCPLVGASPVSGDTVGFSE